MIPTPILTVVIPSHRRPDMLSEAVRSCLDQAREVPLEVCVVHDGPGEASRRALEDQFASEVGQRLHFREQPPLGGQHARQRGLLAARGRYVKFLDDDDYLARGALASELDALESSGADLSFGELDDVDVSGAPLGRLGSVDVDDLFTGFLRGRVTTHPLRFLVTAELARRWEWNPHIRARQDLDYFMALSRLARRTVPVQRVVGFRRIHEVGARVSSATSSVGAVSHLRILQDQLHPRWQQPLSEEAHAALLQALWFWSRLAELGHPAEAKRARALVLGLEPRFVPQRRGRAGALLGALDRWWGCEATEDVLLPARRLKSRLRL